MEASLTEDLAQLGDVALQGGRGGVGSTIAPQMLDQGVGRHELIGVDHEKGKERPPFGAAKLECLAAAPRSE